MVTARPPGARSKRSVGSSPTAPSGRRTSTGTPPDPPLRYRLHRGTGRTNVTTEGQRAGGTAMRSKLRIVTLSCGTVAVLVLVLLSLAAGFGSWMLAIIGGLLGILLVIVGCMVLLTIVDRLTKALDRSSTRARNLESRTEKLAARAEEA